MKQGLDYVLVSYYEDDCNNVVLSRSEWQQVFDSLHVVFPNSKLGIGECGTTNASKKAECMNRYYGMKITTPGYIGGNFWWYYKQDCVPKNMALWDTLNTIICDINTKYYDSPNTSLKVYPNPAKRVITIEANNLAKENTLTILNANGQELIREQIVGSMTQIDIGNLTSGIYFVKLTTDGAVEVRKILKQ